jgi:uracil-DNA glycosylase
MGIDRKVFYNPRLIAVLPMGFCYPGTGTSGDLPPRRECAEHWRRRLLDRLPKIEFTVLLGQYALAWHLPHSRGKNLTETVRNWKTTWPAVLPLPHPSPRNNIWLKKNPWFEREIVPVLNQRVHEILGPELTRR